MDPRPQAPYAARSLEPDALRDWSSLTGLEATETIHAPRSCGYTTQVMASVEKLDLGPARLSEAARIAEMSRRWIEHGLTWRYRPASIAGQIHDSETAVVVARAAPGVVGFAVMEFCFDARRAHLVLLAVEPAYRRRGVGVALFRWLEKLACLGGILQLRLELRADNEEARAFYERLGFRATELRRGYYDGRKDAIRMARRIGRGAHTGEAWDPAIP
jgi:ribosomal-protein-alanine N-acetyltransferase